MKKDENGALVSFSKLAVLAWPKGLLHAGRKTRILPKEQVVMMSAGLTETKTIYVKFSANSAARR